MVLLRLSTFQKSSVLHQGSVGNLDSRGSKNLTLKRSHDQMMTIENKGRIETATPSAGKLTKVPDDYKF